MRGGVSVLITSGILYAILMLAICIQPVKPLSMPQLSFIPVQETVRVGQIFDINITINDLDASSEMIAWSVVFYPHTDELEFLSATEGPFLGQFSQFGTLWNVDYWGQPTITPYLAVSSLLIPNQTGEWAVFPHGNGTLATITFRAIAEGNITFHMQKSSLVDSDEAAITHVTNDGFLEIKPALFGDLNFDGKVDTTDIALGSSAFGSYPEHPRWNSLADVNKDGKICIMDIALISRNFGKH